MVYSHGSLRLVQRDLATNLDTLRALSGASYNLRRGRDSNPRGEFGSPTRS